MPSELKHSAQRIAPVVAALAIGVCLNGCVGVVLVGAGATAAAAGGLAATEEDRDAASGDNAVPPAQRVPPAATSENIGSPAQQGPVSVQPVR